jgi:hypothetical protein
MASKMRTRIEEEFADSEMLFADGFDEAIMGVVVASAGNGYHEQVLYDYQKCIDILVKRDGMTQDDAAEFLEFNTVGAYVGEHTPLFMVKP